MEIWPLFVIHVGATEENPFDVKCPIRQTSVLDLNLRQIRTWKFAPHCSINKCGGEWQSFCNTNHATFRHPPDLSIRWLIFVCSELELFQTLMQSSWNGNVLVTAELLYCIYRIAYMGMKDAIFFTKGWLHPLPVRHRSKNSTYNTIHLSSIIV